MDVRVPIENLGHEAESFPERDTVDGGIEGHDANPLERTFEQNRRKRRDQAGWKVAREYSRRHAVLRNRRHVPHH